MTLILWSCLTVISTTASLSYVLSVNPGVKIYAPKESFGIFGCRPASTARTRRYLHAVLPRNALELMKFGTAWQNGNFELIDETTEVAPGITLIALVSDAPASYRRSCQS
jgi:7,8-dihydropterin-6-yl-methyl-4-(beta-D-ribofuranosyl)aminobenzene 5'-phosphate synthase